MLLYSTIYINCNSCIMLPICHFKNVNKTFTTGDHLYYICANLLKYFQLKEVKLLMHLSKKKRKGNFPKINLTNLRLHIARTDNKR